MDLQRLLAFGDGVCVVSLLRHHKIKHLAEIKVQAQRFGAARGAATGCRGARLTHFHAHVISDVLAANKRLADSDTPSHRRDVVRTAFSAIEGLHWQLKRDVITHLSDVRLPTDFISIHERAALLEETYSVNERGLVRTAPRFLPVDHALRLLINVVIRYRPVYEPSLEDIGWANLKAALVVRNRLTHPKSLGDLEVTDDDLRKTLSGFYWLLALVIEVLRIHTDMLTDLGQEVIRGVEGARGPNPDEKPPAA